MWWLGVWLLSAFYGSDSSSGNWAENLMSSGFEKSVFTGTHCFDLWDVKQHCSTQERVFGDC